jgi:hypothetical protein
MSLLAMFTTTSLEVTDEISVALAISFIACLWTVAIWLMSMLSIGFSTPASL